MLGKVIEEHVRTTKDAKSVLKETLKRILEENAWADDGSKGYVNGGGHKEASFAEEDPTKL